MWILYLFGVRLYGLAIRISALFNGKAKEWILGRRDWQRKLSAALAGKDEKRIWFHCSSLGEFEQGRPVLEAIKKEYPDHKIVLTFFSPSGYNIKKNDPVANYIFYLPLDGPIRSKKFISVVNPVMAFFVKYEFWYFYGRELHNRKIPFFCVSAIFRPGQVFFHTFGDFFRRILLRYTHLFVQDQESLQLLYKHRITNVTVSGDTRFDRVVTNSLQNTVLPEIEKFRSGTKIIIFGSTWPLDEEIFVPYINQSSNGIKFIIAAHEINFPHLRKLKDSFSKKVLFYSELETKESADAEILIIDNIGLLSQLYRYADCAYIGGGFGKGIHNILEAVVYGIPVLFGPNFEKFREARELVKLKGAFTIKSSEELTHALNRLMTDEILLEKICNNNKQFISEKKGATDVILGFLRMNYSHK